MDEGTAEASFSSDIASGSFDWLDSDVDSNVSWATKPLVDGGRGSSSGSDTEGGSGGSSFCTIGGTEGWLVAAEAGASSSITRGCVKSYNYSRLKYGGLSCHETYRQYHTRTRDQCPIGSEVKSRRTRIVVTGGVCLSDKSKLTLATLY